jgi:hypothetical protein
MTNSLRQSRVAASNRLLQDAVLRVLAAGERIGVCAIPSTRFPMMPKPSMSGTAFERLRLSR